MGQTRAILRGAAGILSSGPLTVCSCLVLQATRNGEVLATLMSHRGTERADVFKSNFLNELKRTQLEGKDIRWKLLAFQTASLTLNSGQGGDLVEGGVGPHECTAEAIMADVSEFVDINTFEMRNVRDTAPQSSIGTTECEAAVKPDGETRIPKRTGGCVIL